jgi:AraC-like DNA-binding protein
MDVLDDILATLKLRGSLYFRTDFSAPWGVTVPHYQQAARFHLVVEGRCCVRVGAGETRELGPGDLILIPRGLSHVLSDLPRSSAPPLETVLSDAGYDGEGVLVLGKGDGQSSTRMICGHFSFRDGANHPVLNALPEQLVTTASARAQHPLLDETLRLVTRGLFSGDPGSQASVTRLSEIVFIELLRSGVAEVPAMQRLLQAFLDPKIGRALHLLHRHPEHHWTVERLAAEVAMSRSRLADRFRNLVGVGPMAYLSDWRLQKALALLQDTRQSVQQVASETGYRSPSAFSRAFHDKFGLAPREYRSGGTAG